MRTHDRSLLANLASLLVCGVLAGVVVAAAAFPAVAIAGLGIKAGATGFQDLPTQLHVLPSPQVSYIYASDNKTLIATIYDENRHDIPLSQIPKVMQEAIVSAEDSRFYEHHGVDLQGVIRAFVANQGAGETTQGASTLTMQYVRQALTYSSSSPQQVVAATEETNARKLREMKYALALENRLSKGEILERYLNIAAFGHGAYGIYAASQVYFGKAPKDLKLEEAAMLAGLVKAPSSFDPTTESGRPQALVRRTYVLDQMARNGYITEAQAKKAEAVPLKVTGKRTPNGCVATSQNQWGFFCDYLYRWWLQQDQLGKDPSSREALLKQGGYRIISSLDVKVQAAAHKNIEKQLKDRSTDALMLAAIEPGTGRIKAMAVNRVYGLDTSHNGPSSDPVKRKLGIKGTYPVTTNPLISGGGDITGYKAGSTFKMFTMLAALEQGYTLDYTIRAVSPYHSKYVVSAKSIAACGDHVHWCPENATPSWMNGVRTMWSGFGRSVNTYWVPMEERVGAQNAVAMAKRLGIQFRAHGTPQNPSDYEFANNPSLTPGWGPFTLGVSDTVPLELANAYATVAADGKYCEPMPVIDIIDRDGNKLTDLTTPRCKQAVKPEIARAALDAARCPVGDKSAFGKCDGGTAYAHGIPVARYLNRPVFGKTGTSDSDWTANLVISTKQLTIAGTLADPDHSETPHGNNDVHKANDATTDTMRDAMKGLPKVQFTAPPKEYAFGKRVRIPDVTCQSVSSAKSRLRSAGFDPVVDNKPVDSTCPAGTVAKTDPSGSTVKGGVVTLFVSSGNPPPGSRPTSPPTPPPNGGGHGGGGGPGGGA